VEEIEFGNHENDIFVRPIKSISTNSKSSKHGAWTWSPFA